MKRDTMFMWATMVAAMSMMVGLVWLQAQHDHPPVKCMQGERK